MIIEIGAGCIFLIGFGVSLYQTTRPLKGDDSFYLRHLDDRDGPPKALEQSYSTHVELVLELLKTDVKYKVEHKSPTSYSNMTHYTFDAGVRLTEIVSLMGGGNPYLNMDLLDENGVYNSVDTSSAEATALRAALKAYQTRAKRAREEELTRLLAERVLNPGTVRPVLESPAVRAIDQLNDNHREPDNDVVSTSYVTFDKERQQVVRVGPEDAKQVMTSSDFEQRYGLRAENNTRALMAKHLRQQGIIGIRK